ncbi:MAG: hypothetical protein IJV37_08415 [Bacteroidales bacterium]|nr:hypothetical protein [Bacteroidales bacterium]
MNLLKPLLFCLALSASFSLRAEQIPLVPLQNRDTGAPQGTAWGVPFAKGAVRPAETAFTLTDANGRTIPSSAWTLATWPDGSLKWLGMATNAAQGSLTLHVQPAPKARGRKAASVPAPRTLVQQTPEGLRVDTGVMTCLLPADGSSFIRELSLGGRLIASDGELVARWERRSGSARMRTVTQEECLGRVEKVTLVQDNPMRAVVKVEGRHRAESGREWLPYAVYCIFYADLPTIQLTHSFVFDSDGREDFLAGIGVRFRVPFREQVHNRHVRFAGDGQDGAGFWCQPVRLAPGYRPSAGSLFVDNYQPYLRGARLPDEQQLSESERAALLTCPVWGDMRLVQTGSNGFTIDKRTTEASSWVHYVEGTRSLGGALLGDCSGSLFVGVKDFWQNYPAALHVDRAGEPAGYLTAWLWAPDGPAMDMRHYDTVPHDLRINYEDYKAGWESPYGVGHRSTLEIRLFDGIPANEELLAVAKAVQKPLQYSCTPEYLYSVHAFGDYWALPRPEHPVYAEIERQLDENLEFYRRQIDERSWYGFWNYGDVMHNYDFTRHDWRYDIGGWAWNNVELAPNVLLWTCFLRTGREDIWTMAEALEKHASEVDVHHLGQFAPLGSRHNVSHWGDGAKQPRISYAGMKRYLYYLTGGDPLTGDRMKEQLGAEKAYDHARRISTWGAVGGTYIRSSLNDWGYYAGNWMIEWERTGDTFWRDRLLNSIRDLTALSRISGRLAFDYFDPETGRFMVWLNEQPAAQTDRRRPLPEVNAPASEFVPASTLSDKKLRELVGWRLSEIRPDSFSTIFGIPELLADIRATVDAPEFWKYVDNSFRALAHVGGGSMTGPRMAAWIADAEGDAEMGALAWRNLLDNGQTLKESDGTPAQPHPLGERIATPDLVKPYGEPHFLGRDAGWQLHTPSTVQWLLNAIEVMEWAQGAATD